MSQQAIEQYLAALTAAEMNERALHIGTDDLAYHVNQA